MNNRNQSNRSQYYGGQNQADLYSQETSDRALLDLLFRNESMTISELASKMGVTATAVRQRLSRLTTMGLVDRVTIRAGRGRPSHSYRITGKGRKAGGNNFTDLANVLWHEIRSISDPVIRRGLLQRIANRMVGIYAPKLQGRDRQARLDAIAELLTERGIPFDISDSNQSGTDRSGTGGNKRTGQEDSSSSAQRQDTAKNGFTGAGGRGLPVITMFGCPYPELAEQDRSICALERMVFSGMLDEDVRLTTCRLDGDSCCEFEAAL